MWLRKKRLSHDNDYKNQNAGVRVPARGEDQDLRHTVEGQKFSFSTHMINDAFVILFWSFHGYIRQGGRCLSVQRSARP